MPRKYSLRSYPGYLVLLPVIIVFILIKVPWLNLPYYWDEAWSYAVAVLDMHEHGLAILPGDGNTELTRGHPLLFYFLSAAWTKVFGTSLVAVHLFPLLISCLLLIAVYILADQLFDRITAAGAVVLFLLQSEFFTQSTMLLPEVMLAFWTTLALFSYFKNKWGLYIVSSVCLVMTKETGMVLIFTLLLDKLLLERLFKREQKKSIPVTIKELLILAIPLAVFAAFMITQKIRSGWFLFPDHVNMMIVDPHELLNRFRLFITKLFLMEGRNIFFFGAIAATIYLVFKKSISRQFVHYLLVLLMFILAYIAFSSMNFFTVRYLLSVIPVFVITGTWLIISPFRRDWMKITVIGIMSFVFAWNTFIDNKNESDVSTGYKNTVILQKQAVNFAEEMNWQQKNIYSAFLMQYYMGIPNLGYLNGIGKPFYHVKNKPEIDYDLYIFCSNERDPLYEFFRENEKIDLIKRFENKQSWVEIYGKRNP